MCRTINIPRYKETWRYIARQTIKHRVKRNMALDWKANDKTQNKKKHGVRLKGKR